MAVGTAGKIFALRFLLCDLVITIGIRQWGIWNVEQVSGLGEPLPIAVTEQAVVAHFDEARWQHVLEEAADELLSREGTGSDLLSG